MPDQPERPIEKLLRECGKRRVPSDALELHPANRRLLQDEVARTYPGKMRRLSWFGPHFLPKLAWGLGAFSVVAAVAWLSLSSSRQTESDSLMARNERALPSAAPRNAPIPVTKTEPAPALPSNLTLADKRTTAPQEPSAATALNGPPPLVPQTDAPTMVSMSLAEQQLATDATARTELAGTTAARALQASAPASGAFRYGLASTAPPLLKQTDQSTTTENFVREQIITRQTDKEKRVQPILASFKFERTGSEIRITDQDGSIYSGTLGPLQSQFAMKTGRRDQAGVPQTAQVFIATKKPSPAGSVAEFTFHVSGTNRTLGELVSFEGRWSTLTNMPSPVQVTKDLNRGVSLDRQIPSPSAPASPSATRIWGAAVIRGTDSVNINAVSVPP